MELKFTLFIKFALVIIIVILALFLAFWNKFKSLPKFNFNLLTNSLYKFKYYNTFLFPKPC